ncbi:hypothetical protein MTO96_002356 [Rhipicephalus appendiculatus]
METKYATAVNLDDLPLYWDPRYNRYFYRGIMPSPTGTPALEAVYATPTVEAVFSADTPAVTPIFVRRDAEGNRSRPSSGNRVRWTPGIPSPQHTKAYEARPTVGHAHVPLRVHGAFARFTHLAGYPDAVENRQRRKERRLGDVDLGRRRGRRRRLQAGRQTFRRPRASAENKTVTDAVQQFTTR